MNKDLDWVAKHKTATAVVSIISVLCSAAMIYGSYLLTPLLAKTNFTTMLINLNEKYGFINIIFNNKITDFILSQINYFLPALIIIVCMAVVTVFIKNIFNPKQSWENLIKYYVQMPANKAIQTSLLSSAIVGIFSVIGGIIGNLISSNIINSGFGVGAVSGMVAATIITAKESAQMILDKFIDEKNNKSRNSKIKTSNNQENIYREMFTNNKSIMGYLNQNNTDINSELPGRSIINNYQDDQEQKTEAESPQNADSSKNQKNNKNNTSTTNNKLQ